MKTLFSLGYYVAGLSLALWGFWWLVPGLQAFLDWAGV
jgi:hypothetical protein